MHGVVRTFASFNVSVIANVEDLVEAHCVVLKRIIGENDKATEGQAQRHDCSDAHMLDLKHAKYGAYLQHEALPEQCQTLRPRKVKMKCRRVRLRLGKP